MADRRGDLGASVKTHGARRRRFADRFDALRRSGKRLPVWAVVALGAAMLVWPACVDRFPLVGPDSIGYMGDGLPILLAMVFRRTHHVANLRSEFYVLGIYLWHLNRSVWAILVLNTTLSSYVIFLAVRSIVPRQSNASFLAILALLSVMTGLSWTACYVLPDFLTPLVYLSLYLLIFAREGLSRPERRAVVAILWWGLTAHATHLAVGMGMCLLLWALLLVGWRPLQGRARGIGLAAAVVLFAACSQFALHRYLYGKATLNGRHPPYLMARVIADGPGAWYLKQHCGSLDWVVCRHVDDLPATAGDFLWKPGGVWASATPAEQEMLIAEETPLLRGALRVYPAQQIGKSFANFAAQMTEFDFDTHVANEWVPTQMNLVVFGSRPGYMRSLQARGALPSDAFMAMQKSLVICAAVSLLFLLPLAWRVRRMRVLGLATVLLPAMTANAFVCGALSEAVARYQARVIWLLPLLAMLLALDMFGLRPELQGAAGEAGDRS